MRKEIYSSTSQVQAAKYSQNMQNIFKARFADFFVYAKFSEGLLKLLENFIIAFSSTAEGNRWKMQPYFIRRANSVEK